MDRKIRTSLIAVGTDGLLIALKGGAALITGSLALRADALHSLSDLAVSIGVLIGLLVRRWYGRGELTASGRHRGYWIETAIAAVVSLLILYMPLEIIGEVRNAQPEDGIRHAWVGILAVVIAIAGAYFIARLKLIVGRETDSPALEADGHHSRMDVFSSIAVLASLVGGMIGIWLDPLVAVVIAVLIASMAIQLFVSSVVSLLRGEEFRELPLWPALAERVWRPLARRWRGDGRPDWRALLRPRRLAAAALMVLAAYSVSGFSVIQPGEVGVRLRFGQVVAGELAPGLHPALPWPLERVARVDTGLVRRVELGFRSTGGTPAHAADLFWDTREDPAGYQSVPEEALIATGDGLLLDARLVVHYRPREPVAFLYRSADAERQVRGLAEARLREIVATRAAEAVLGEERVAVGRAVQDGVQADSDALGLGLEVSAVYFHDVRPPLDVVPNYREVISALEQRTRRLYEAESYQNRSLPEARATRLSRLADAQAFAREEISKAEAEAARFAELAGAYRRAPEVTGYRLFLETVEQGLAGREKFVVDPRADRGEYQLWMFGSGQLPMRPLPAGSK